MRAPDASRNAAGQNLVNLTDEVTRNYAVKVAAAAAQGQVVVVFLHWGCNWDWMIPASEVGTPNDRCAWGNTAAGCPGTKPWGCDAARRQKFGRAMIDAGAAVVWGTSSHHVQPIELYKDGIIIYGPGNTIFQNGFEPDAQTIAEYRNNVGMLVQVDVVRAGGPARTNGTWQVVSAVGVGVTHTSMEARLLVADGSHADQENLAWFNTTMQRICKPYETQVAVGNGGELIFSKRKTVQ